MMRNTRKRATSKTKKNSSRLAWFFRSPWVWFVLFQLMMINGWYLLYQRTILSFAVSAPLEITETIPTPATQPVSIEIVTADIKTSITPASINEGIWQTSDNTASHLIYSAKPGEAGNIVIYAHNRRQLFANLPQAKVDDVISVTTEDGKAHNYRVNEIMVVSPDQVEVVMPTDSETLTLYTCTGPFDSKRLVIKAIPV